MPSENSLITLESTRFKQTFSSQLQLWAQREEKAEKIKKVVFP
jgi:hypothetical protein